MAAKWSSVAIEFYVRAGRAPRLRFRNTYSARCRGRMRRTPTTALKMFRGLVEMFLAHRHSRESWDPKQALSGRDRRIFQRVVAQLPCKIDNRLFGLESEGSTTNLSLGGMALIAPVTWPEGSQVRVHFESLVMDGLIVYRKDATVADKECRYGVKFQKLRLRDLLKLRKVLQGHYQGPLAVL